VKCSRSFISQECDNPNQMEVCACKCKVVHKVPEIQ
jgi:hypothetical protein